MTNLTPSQRNARRVIAAAVLTLVALPVLAWTAPGSTVTSNDVIENGVVQRIDVRTLDYAFEMPATLQAGLTQVTLVNDGKEPHHLWILKLEDGKRLADVFASLKNTIEFPKWARNVGGPNSPVPGGRSVALIDLEPGHYAVLCVIPAADGVPHVMKGMAKEFDVVGAYTAPALPRADIVATLSDYDFTFSEPLSAGRKLIRFTNAAAQVHEAFIAKLEPGKTAADLLGWFANKMQGPPPAIPMGGITGIEPGRSITVVQDLTPGTYAFYCFVADAKDGREHIAHGMMKEFTIPAR